MTTKARFTTTTRLNRTKGGLCCAPLEAILGYPQQEVRKHRQARVHCQFSLHSACCVIEQCIRGHRTSSAMVQSLTHQSSNLPSQMPVTRTSNDPAVQYFNKYTVYVCPKLLWAAINLSSEFFTTTIADRRDCKRPQCPCQKTQMSVNH